MCRDVYLDFCSFSSFEICVYSTTLFHIMRVPPFRVDAFNMHVAVRILPRIKLCARSKHRITYVTTR